MNTLLDLYLETILKDRTWLEVSQYQANILKKHDSQGEIVWLEPLVLTTKSRLPSVIAFKEKESRAKANQKLALRIEAKITALVEALSSGVKELEQVLRGQIKAKNSSLVEKLDLTAEEKEYFNKL